MAAPRSASADAAAGLLVAWGCRRGTVDEAARRADVGKGTV